MNFANKISMFRILCVPFFVASLIYYSPEKDYFRFIALGIFVLGVISDAVDGFVARISKQTSKAGLVLDPLGDKLLLMGAFIFLSEASKLPLKFPLWITLVVISRDIIILLGTVLIFMIKQKLDIYPTKWGKVTTVFQMSSVICLLLNFKFSGVVWYAAVIFTLVSGADYIRRGFKILYAVDNNRIIG